MKKLLLAILILEGCALAQQPVLIRPGGSIDFAGQNAASPPSAVLTGCQFQTVPTTISAGNASPCQLDNAGNLLVHIAAGGGSGGTSATDKSAFTAGTTAGTPVMGAVNPVDTPANGTVAIMALDGSRNVKVNCVSGCSGAADTTGTGNLTALNSNVTIALAGLNSASFTLPAGNNLVGTLTPEISNDGGTTWIPTYLRQNSLATNNFWASTVVVSSTQSSWDVMITGGASNVRIRVSAYTSGAANSTIVKGTQQPELVSSYTGVAGQAVPPYVAVVGGTDGSNTRALSVNSTGQLNVLQAVANWTVNLNQVGGAAFALGQQLAAASLPVVLTSAQLTTLTPLATVTANQGGAPWTINLTQFGGNNVVTGTGASGVGIPRVTVSNDSNIQASQSGTWNVTVNTALPTGSNTIGKVDILGNAGAIMDFAGQNAASPANALLTGCQFNTSPTAISSGNVSPCQLDTNGNLLVHIAAGGGSGGTSAADKSAFAVGSTAGTPLMGAVAPVDTVVAGTVAIAAIDTSRNLKVNCVVGCSASAAYSTDSLNRLNVIVGNTVPVSGSVSVTIKGGIGNQPVSVVGGALSVYEPLAPLALGQNAISPSNELIVGGQFNNTPTTLVNGNVSPLQLDSAGNLLTNIKAGTITATGTITTTQGSSPWTVTDSGAIQELQILANKAGITQIVGGLGNQPVSVTGNSLSTYQSQALPTGTNTIGAVTQASGPWTVSGTVTANQGGAPWSDNITQFGGTNLSTGTGASGAGIPRVTVANDSNIQASQSGTWNVTVNTALPTGSNTIGKVDILGNAGAIMDFAGQNAASPANALLTGCQFNTAPTTISSGNASPCQLDSAGNLLVNIKAGGGAGGTSAADKSTFTVGSTSGTPLMGAVAPVDTVVAGTVAIAAIDTSRNLKVNCVVGCGGSGGTSVADESAFTQGTTNLTPIGGIYSTAITNLTSGQAGVVQLTADRMLVGNIGRFGGALVNIGPQTPANSIPVVDSGAEQVLQQINGRGAQGLSIVGGIGGGQRVNVTGNALSVVQTYPLPTGTNVIGGVTQSGTWNVAATTANLNQINGTTLNLGPQNSASSLPVTNTGEDRLLGRLTAKAGVSSSLVGGLATQSVSVQSGAMAIYEAYPATSFDPCSGPNKWNVPVSTSSNVQLVSGVGGKPIHICSDLLVATTAGSFSLVGGTGATCATGIEAIVGATTAANGIPVAATAGYSRGNGQASVAQSNVGGNNICILLTGTGLVAGNMEVAY